AAMEATGSSNASRLKFAQRLRVTLLPSQPLPPRPPRDPRAAAAPRASLLAAALAHLDEGVIVTGKELTPDGLPILFANEAFARMTGHRVDELVGRAHASLHQDPRDLRALRRWHRKLTVDQP